MRLNLGLLEAGTRASAWRSGRDIFRAGAVVRIARRDPVEDGGEGYEAVLEPERGRERMHVVLGIDFTGQTAVLEEWACDCTDQDVGCAHTVAAALAVRDVLGRSDTDDVEADDGWQQLAANGSVSAGSLRNSWICYDLSLESRDGETSVGIVRRRRTMNERGARGGAVLGWTPTAVGHFGYRTGSDPAKNRDDLIPVLCVVNRHDLRVRTLQPGFVDVFLRLFADAEPYTLRVDGEDARVDGAERPVTLSVEDAPDGGLEVRARLRAATPGGEDDEIIPMPGPVPWLYLRREHCMVRPGTTSQLVLELLRRRRVHVPSDEIDAFCRDVLPLLRADGELRERSSRLPPLRNAEAEPRILLDEVDGNLAVSLRFAYPPPPGLPVGERDDGLEVDAAGQFLFDPGAGARIFARHIGEGGKSVLWQRDEAFETSWSQRVADAVHAALPATLTTDAALDFLLDRLPELENAGARVFGREGLTSLRATRHTVSARIRLSSGIDWFGARLEMTVGDLALDPAEVLRAFRAGARHVRLDNGELARLPTAWLNRNLGALTDLEELGTDDGEGGFRIAPYLVPSLMELAREGEALDTGWRQLRDRLGDFAGIGAQALPTGLRADLRSYQKHGYDWVCALRDLGLHGCLADDMGLGKTVQTLAVLLAEVETGRARGPSLVVAPTSVVQNWVDEAARFAPALRVLRLGGEDRAGRLESLAAVAEHDIVVTSYALLRQDIECLAAVDFHYAVLDEAQAIKNPNSQTARASRRVRAQHRLTLTGTPIENNLLELWSQFEFLMPGFFGSRARFVRRYGALGNDEGQGAQTEALRTRLRPFVLRRLKADVDRELPPVTEMTLRCRLGESQRALYDKVRNTYRSRVLSLVDEVGVERATLGVLEALLRLRQAACHPELLPFAEARKVRESAKTKTFLRVLGELLDEGRRVLVFSQWTSMLRILRTELDEVGVRYAYLDGSTRDRAAVVQSFQRPDGPGVFLISLKAGGVGLNLTAADTVIHYDPWWNPAAEQQASDRAHRIGQTRPVLVLRLVAEETVEEMILSLQERKRDLMRRAIESETDGVKALGKAELVAIFGEGGATLSEPIDLSAVAAGGGLASPA
ncbi:MAG: SNF2 helicase associated domain-containing protein [Deltaproteobacteria bacterium]|nr:SNF2 helicase associated domain-containing protein [Deltaproteobacteria bacterium]